MDDIASIESVQPLDQLSFWCLTVSTMLKLVAMGATVFTLPFNNWVQLQRAEDHHLLIVRGIAGSDCVSRDVAEEGGVSSIKCVHWSEGADQRSAFWARQGISDIWMELPGTVHQALFWLVLLQLVLFLLDICATLVMCCRYKSQKDTSTSEKRVSLGLSIAILFLYLVVVITAISANFDFTHSRHSFQSSLGIAFWLYLGMTFLYAIGCVLTHFSRLMALRQSEEGIWKGFFGGGGGETEERGGGRSRRRQGRRDEQIQTR